MRPDAIDWAHREGVSLAFLPRQRMHHMLWRWIVIITIVQAAVAAAVLIGLQGPWRAVFRPDPAPMIADLAADKLSGGTFGPGDAATQRLLQDLVDRPDITFAAVVDEEDAFVFSVSDASADVPRALRDARESGLPTSDKPGVAAIDIPRNLLILNAPLRSAAEGRGYRLLLVVPDLAGRRAMLDGAVALSLGLLAVAVGMLPLAYMRLRRWTVGLSRLHTAIRGLAQGADPKPLAIGGEDEVAYLSIAFNDMASQLLASRRALIEANKDLELRVEQRTAELRTAADQLEKLATSDMLTGLPNRRALTTQLQTMFRTSTRDDKDLVCLALDLDGFKRVNDVLGHASGDEILQIASEVFRAACRSTDLIVRLGGDEFVMLVALESPEAAVPLGERLLKQFHERCSKWLKDHPLDEMPSMSIGIASRKQTGVPEAEQLLQAADAALYRAKGAGKACIQLWQPADGRPHRAPAASTAP